MQVPVKLYVFVGLLTVKVRRPLYSCWVASPSLDVRTCAWPDFICFAVYC